MLSETNWVQQNGTKYGKIFEWSIGVIKQHTLICTLTKDNYLSCLRNASELIQNTKPTKMHLDIYVIRLYCYMFQSMRDHHGTGINCQIFYKELSKF